jgi:hypothetical protein
VVSEGTHLRSYVDCGVSSPAIFRCRVERVEVRALETVPRSLREMGYESLRKEVSKVDPR